MSDIKDTDNIDWSLTSWEGSRREQYRRWARLSLREILLAQEEMYKQNEQFQANSEKNNSSMAELDPLK